MQQHELLKSIHDTLAELAATADACRAAAERVRSILAAQNNADPHDVPPGHEDLGCLSGDRLMVDPATFTLGWHGHCCSLGPTILFKLIQYLARRPGCYWSYDILMQQVWRRRCSNATVRSAVKRLRRAMCDAGMPDLAASIRGRAEYYGVFLNGACP